MTPASAIGLRQIGAAFRSLGQAGAGRQQATILIIDLACLRLAIQRGLVEAALLRLFRDSHTPDRDLRSALALLPGADPESCAGGDLAAAAAAVGSLDEQSLGSRLPGDLYEMLLQIPLDEAEASAQQLRSRRRTQGIFYTPAPIIQEIIGLAVGKEPGQASVCDPAMGAGHFLVAVAEAWIRSAGNSPAGACAAVASGLFGADRDPLAVRTAIAAMRLVLSEPGIWREPAPGNLVCSDTLLDADPLSPSFPPGGFDCLLGNPPYDVLTNFSRNPPAREYADALRASGRYALSTSGQLNLYRCFIERGLQLLRPGGLLSFVVPASLLTDSAAAGLRQALLRHHAMDHVHSYSEKARVFPGTTQAVCVLRACRDAGRADPVRVAFSCRKPGRFHDIPLPLIESLGADLPVPRAGPDDWRLLAWLTEHAPCRFDSLAESFVGEVDQTFYAAHMKDEATDSLLARGCHLAPFCLDLRPAPGRQRFLDRPAFLAQKGKAAGACLSRAARERVVQLGIRNLSCRPRLVAARAPAGVFLGNSLNFFLPRPGRSLLLVTGLLNCALYDWRFRMTSGNNNINLREISGLPLPANLDARLAARVEEATRLCERTATQGVDLLLARRELDAAVCDLFGLPADLRHFC